MSKTVKCSLTAHEPQRMTLNIYFFTNEAASHLHSSTTACYNANIMIFQQFCKDFPYFLGMKSRKIKKKQEKSRKIIFFSQRRTNTDKYGRGQFFMSYLCTVESERCGRVFPLATPTKCLRVPYRAQGGRREFVGKTD